MRCWRSFTYTDASDIGIGFCEGTIVRVSGAVGRHGTTHILYAEKNTKQKLREKEPRTC